MLIILFNFMQKVPGNLLTQRSRRYENWKNNQAIFIFTWPSTNRKEQRIKNKQKAKIILRNNKMGRLFIPAKKAYYEVLAVKTGIGFWSLTRKWTNWTEYRTLTHLFLEARLVYDRDGITKRNWLSIWKNKIQSDAYFIPYTTWLVYWVLPFFLLQLHSSTLVESFQRHQVLSIESLLKVLNIESFPLAESPLPICSDSSLDLGKLWYIHTLNYFTTVKINQQLLHFSTWIYIKT